MTWSPLSLHKSLTLPLDGLVFCSPVCLVERVRPFTSQDYHIVFFSLSIYTTFLANYFYFVVVNLFVYYGELMGYNVEGNYVVTFLENDK